MRSARASHLPAIGMCTVTLLLISSRTRQVQSIVSALLVLLQLRLLLSLLLFPLVIQEATSSSATSSRAHADMEDVAHIQLGVGKALAKQPVLTSETGWLKRAATDCLDVAALQAALGVFHDLQATMIDPQLRNACIVLTTPKHVYFIILSFL